MQAPERLICFAGAYLGKDGFFVFRNKKHVVAVKHHCPWTTRLLASWRPDNVEHLFDATLEYRSKISWYQHPTYC